MKNDLNLKSKVMKPLTLALTLALTGCAWSTHYEKVEPGYCEKVDKFYELNERSRKPWDLDGILAKHQKSVDFILSQSKEEKQVLGEHGPCYRKYYGVLFALRLNSAAIGGRSGRIKWANYGRRNPGVRRKFHSRNPCPSTGKTYGACPGYHVDHVVPLACGGADATYNMQWLTAKRNLRKGGMGCRYR